MLFTEEGGAINHAGFVLAIEGEYATEIGLRVVDGHVRWTGIKR